MAARIRLRCVGLILVLGAVTGCSKPAAMMTTPPPQSLCDAGPLSVKEMNVNPTPLAIVDDPVQVPIDVVVTGCGVETIHAELTVVDPDDQPIAATTQFSTWNTSPGYPNGEFIFGFKPPRPGPYHLTARIEPNQITLQTDVNVAADRRYGGTLADVDQPCLLLDHHDDALICSSTPDAGVHLIVDGGTVQSVSGDTFAHAGELVWVLAGADVTPYRFAGTQLEPAAAPTALPDVAPRYLLARGNQALVLGANHLQQLTLEADGGVSLAGKGDYQGNPAGMKAHWVPDVAVDLAHEMAPAGCQIPFTPVSSVVCYGSFVADIPMGANDDGVWSVRELTGVLAVDATQPDGGWIEQTLYLSSYPLGTDDFSDAAPQATPFMSEPGASWVPRFDGGEITFDAFPPGWPHPQGNLIWYVVNGSDGGVNQSALLPGRVRYFDR